MLRRRASPPVLATISAPAGGGIERGALARTELGTFEGVLRGIGASRAVLVTGGRERPAIALGLAAAAVAGGRRVALLECDFAASSLASRLELASGPGLADYLRRDAGAPAILQAVVVAGPAGGREKEPLVCVVAGDASPADRGLLPGGDFEHAMAKLRSAYDLVVLDGPALVDRDEGEGVEEEEDAAEALVAAVRRVDFSIACCPASGLPKRLRAHVDGLIVPAAAAQRS